MKSRIVREAFFLIICLVFLTNFMGCSTANITAPPEQPPILIGEDNYTKSNPGILSMYDQSNRNMPISIHAPSNLNAKLVVTTPGDLNLACRLNWRDNSDNESGFRIERRCGEEGVWNWVGHVNSGIVFYIDETLECDRTYYYRAHAYRDGINSPSSNAVLVSTRSFVDEREQKS